MIGIIMLSAIAIISLIPIILQPPIYSHFHFNLKSSLKISTKNITDIIMLSANIISEVPIIILLPSLFLSIMN